MMNNSFFARNLSVNDRIKAEAIYDVAKFVYNAKAEEENFERIARSGRIPVVRWKDDNAYYSAGRHRNGFRHMCQAILGLACIGVCVVGNVPVLAINTLIAYGIL